MGKKIRDGQIYSLFSHFIGKGFSFEREIIKGLTLIVRLNEKQTLIESFFLRRSPRGGTEYINFFMGKSYYRDINFYFVYDKQYKQWFTSGPDFFNETICEKVTNRNFNLKAFGKNIYYTEKKGNGYAIGNFDQRRALGYRSYLMPTVWDNDDIWVAKNETFYITANASEMRGRTFLTQRAIKYMGSYWVNDNNKKELRSILPNFQSRQFHSWMRVSDDNLSYQNELIFYSYTYYGSFGQIRYPVMSFEFRSSNIKK